MAILQKQAIIEGD